jgi:hypothetical protein
LEGCDSTTELLPPKKPSLVVRRWSFANPTLHNANSTAISGADDQD